MEDYWMKRLKKQFPTADGLIITENLMKAEAIKFK
jgi:hypothetical protein